MKKIKDLEADKFFDFLAAVSPIASYILEMPEIMDLLGLGDMPSTSVKISYAEKGKQVVQLICNALPLILKTHRNNIYDILALLNDKSVEDIKKMKAGEITQQIYSLIRDQDFASFFSSAAK